MERTPGMSIVQMKTGQTVAIDILVVDDFTNWQHFVKTCLCQKPDMHIAGSATTAAEAIQKAKELQPDLVTMDINLCGLDGIEAARQIRTLIPRSRILFLSGNTDPEVVRLAFMAGGDGYVLKRDAARELVAGVEAVLLGHKFISSGLADIDMVF
jgi:DNA-binding NarL/FixJ family response regulator